MVVEILWIGEGLGAVAPETLMMQGRGQWLVGGLVIGQVALVIVDGVGDGRESGCGGLRWLGHVVERKADGATHECFKREPRKAKKGLATRQNFIMLCNLQRICIALGIFFVVHPEHLDPFPIIEVPLSV